MVMFNSYLYVYQRVYHGIAPFSDRPMSPSQDLSAFDTPPWSSDDKSPRSCQLAPDEVIKGDVDSSTKKWVCLKIGYIPNETFNREYRDNDH